MPTTRKSHRCCTALAQAQAVPAAGPPRRAQQQLELLEAAEAMLKVRVEVDESLCGATSRMPA